MFARALRLRKAPPLPRPSARRCLTAAATDFPPASKPRGLLKLFTLSSVGVIGTGAGYSYYQQQTSDLTFSKSTSSSSSKHVSSDAELLSLLRTSFLHGGPEEFDALCELHPDEMDQIISEFVYTASQLEQLGRLHEADALEPYYDRFYDKAGPLITAAQRIFDAIVVFEKEVLAMGGSTEEVERALKAMEAVTLSGIIDGVRKPTLVRDAIVAMEDAARYLQELKTDAAKGKGGSWWGKDSRIVKLEQNLKLWRERMDKELPKPSGDIRDGD
ncbi:hypothetical protein FPQ18DRAFT_401935 [Pyronema domesticum]|uniref:Uncharacterized protein n=1 Tax=Pyronema omphalodes (strain CBS 100304) TaxID=1076935 RepID=U4LB36_PYROM|nr:hypothetical protein FPQ18DRAFT_401935 [Pyronema domesticum]CCX16379.1 Protein of unknown function [Pyronema omphalodes CBS 100304]